AHRRVPHPRPSSPTGGPPYPAVSPDTSRAAMFAVSARAGSGVSVVIGGHLPQVGVDHGLVAAQLIKWRLRDHPTLSHHHHLVRDSLDERQVVLDDDDRRAGLDEPE